MGMNILPIVRKYDNRHLLCVRNRTILKFLHFPKGIKLLAVKKLILNCLLFVFAISVSKAEINGSMYQPSGEKSKLETDLLFWNNKITQSQNGHIYLSKLAAVKEKLFKLTGDISFLKSAERHRIQSLAHPMKDRAPQLCALGRNYISQHRFCDALDVTMEAAALQSQERMTNLMLFDIYLELGWGEDAEYQLNIIGMDRNFDYLIRRAKWEDGEGNLDLAVRYLERAAKLAESSRQQGQIHWIYSNLGDFYGHQGELVKSEEAFKRALAIDPSDAHSMKGLAWITYSDQRKTQDAIAIMEKITASKVSPDLLLLKSEMHKDLNNLKRSQELEKEALNLAMAEGYGRMYQLHIADMIKKERPEKALALIQDELKERPTPEIFAALAEVHYLMGDQRTAEIIATQNVWESTYEPKALLRILPIMKEGNQEIAQQIEDELSGATYELGPVTSQNI